MANPSYAQTRTISRAAEIDEGLRAYMNKVYALMAGAMIITGVVSYVVGMDLRAIMHNQPTTLIPPRLLVSMFTPPLVYLIIFAPLLMVLGFNAAINRMSVGAAQTVFWVFSGVMGLSISSIFALYTTVSITQTFFVTAIAFGGLSLYGYTAKSNLGPIGSFLVMGVFGLIVAMVLNIFLFHSPALDLAVSALGVLIFAGLTAYYTQSIKNTYLAMRTTPGGEVWLEKGAVIGALSLYIAFINMFMFLLRFLGNRN